MQAPWAARHSWSPYLPQSAILSEGEHLQVRAFNGNFLVVVKALAYLLTLGREGIPEAAENAVLNAQLSHAAHSGHLPARL